MTHMLAALAGNIYGPDKPAIGELESFCNRYPYCQPAHMLLSIARKKHGQDTDGTTEKRALAYAIDRQVFVSHMEKHATASKSGKTDVPAMPPAIDELPLLISPAYEALSLPGNDHGGRESNGNRSQKLVFSERQLKQHEIIDRFLAAEPRLIPREETDAEGNLEPDQAGPGLPDLHDDTKEPEDNNEEDEGETNETVAALLVKFGKKDKALRIYEKLCLKYPEKSSYFAKKISDLHSGLNKNTTV